MPSSSARIQAALNTFCPTSRSTVFSTTCRSSPTTSTFPAPRSGTSWATECHRLLEVAFDNPADSPHLISHASLPDWPILAIREKLTPVPGITLLVPATHAQAF